MQLSKPSVSSLSAQDTVLLVDKSAYASLTQGKWSVRGDFAIGEDQPITEWETDFYLTEPKAWAAAIEYLNSRN